MCLTPNYIWTEIGPEWVQIPRPCKLCWQCKENLINDYTGRTLAEAATSTWTATLTLTYRDSDYREYDLAHKIITPEHFQKFIRSMRKRGHKIRYICVGEYGKKKGRAHFHCILFGQTEKPEWPHEENFHLPAWPHGHVYADMSATEVGLRYITKYIRKGDEDDFWFTLSKKPALGHEWFQQKAQREIEYGVMPSSFNYLPPGGRDSRMYMLTGASRRDYLKTLIKGWKHMWPEQAKDLDEWVAQAVQKTQRELMAKEIEQNPISETEFNERFEESLRETEPHPQHVKKVVADIIDRELEDVQYECMQHAIMRNQQKREMENGKAYWLGPYNQKTQKRKLSEAEYPYSAGNENRPIQSSSRNKSGGNTNSAIKATKGLEKDHNYAYI